MSFILNHEKVRECVLIRVSHDQSHLAVVERLEDTELEQVTIRQIDQPVKPRNQNQLQPSLPPPLQISLSLSISSLKLLIPPLMAARSQYLS